MTRGFQLNAYTDVSQGREGKTEVNKVWTDQFCFCLKGEESFTRMQLAFHCPLFFEATVTSDQEAETQSHFVSS